MKKTALLVTVLASAMMWGCEEKTLVIPELEVKRKVLIEEITGVQCNNCPDGTREIVALQQTFGYENLISIAIHAAEGYSDPYPESKYDFRLAEAEDYANNIGVEEGYPSGSVNRILPTGFTTLFLDRSKWKGLITEVIKEDAPMELYVSNEFNTDNRQLDIEVRMVPDQVISEEVRLTVVITQDSIIDVQKDGVNKNKDYVHRHVLRDVVSKVDGDIQTLTPGALNIVRYTVTLPADFKEKHCSVVAFTHHGGNPDKEVLQVAEEHVID